MCTVNLEFRLFVMIKAPDIPAVGRMAALAIHTQFALMSIITFVAAVALNRGVLVVVG